MKKEHYHFIGLGGIGMSALARIAMQQGHKVQGSDASGSLLLEELEKEGASVQIGHNEQYVMAATTVVYSSDIKEQNIEWMAAKKKKLPMLHRSDLLHLLMGNKKPLLVTGTHGKTTTSALLASVLLEANFAPSFVLGGILRSLDCNGKAGEGHYFVAEADESDGSFLKTPSFGAIVTNLGRDHLDYWKTEEKLDAAFAKFCSQVKNKKLLFWCRDDEQLSSLHPEGVSYGFSPLADLRIWNYRQTDKGGLFDLSWEGRHYLGVESALFGAHNALNAAAVFGLALRLEIPEFTIRKALREFSGTKRRLEFKGEAHRLRVYDDYGHHPTEIRATLHALREHIRERRLVALFQPHRFTRVQAQLSHFAAAFHEADLVLMTDIYAAQEAPIAGITSQTLYEEMKKTLGSKLHFIPRAELEEKGAALLMPFDVAITLGAGDITYTGEPILHHFAKRAPKFNLGVLCGGTSIEHEVSLRSGESVFQALDPQIFAAKLFGVDKQGHWIHGPDTIDKLRKQFVEKGSFFGASILRELESCDIVAPLFHGPEGEDGMIQGLLDTLQLPYVGCDYRSSALCMQKSWTKQIALMNNIPTAPFFEMDAHTFERDPKQLLKQIEERRIGYPVWIKAAHLGSSLGITRALTPEEAILGAKQAFLVDETIIAEKEIVGAELEFAVLGNDYVRVAFPGKVMREGFYSYEDKYGSHPIEKRIPASITEQQLGIGQELAQRMYRAAGCKGLARIDFILDQEGHFWLLEANPIPGFTSASGYAKMWKATTGWTLSQICEELIVLALHRARKLAKLRAFA